MSATRKGPRTYSPGKWHEGVPREPRDNVRYRRALLKRAEGDPEFQEGIRQICALDLLFYINAFCWQYNPKKVGNLRIGPFTTWDFQEDAAYTILRCVEDQRDLTIEKSREMGASWLCLFVQEWLWHWHPLNTLLCISRNESLVESEKPDSLFWKIDFVHRYLPDWMMPGGRRDNLRRRALYYGNEHNGSNTTGEATTAKSGVGGRATMMFLDEFSQVDKDFEVLHRTSDTADCRIFNGTHLGLDTAFYTLTQRPDMRKLRMHWTQHPEKRKGLYRYDAEGGKVEVLDKTYHFPPDFNFVMDGSPTGGPYPGLRSPWYDRQCLRKGSPRAVAMDLDINPKGSVDQFFDPVMIQYLKRTHASDPIWEGDIVYDRDTGEPSGLVQVPGGPLKLWLRPDHNGRPPQSKYAGGCDLGAGTGSTPSCISFADATTGEKVLEYTNAHVAPHVFAVIAVALCRWFVSSEGTPVKFCWERQGPGTPFGQKLIELGYRNVYWQTYETKVSNAPSDTPGWYPSPDNKRMLLEDYRAAIASKQFLNRSEQALDECLAFKYGKSGHIEHGEQENTNDPSKARVNHGDRVIADALCYKMVKSMGLVDRKRKEERQPTPDARSIAGRRLMWQHQQASLTDW